MRPVELIALLLMMFPFLALLGVLPAQVGLAAAAVAGATLAVAAFRLGAYWQLLPLYLAVAGSLIGLTFVMRRSKGIRVAIAGLLAALICCTAACAYVLPMFRLPQPSGSYVVGTRIVHLVDPVRMESHVAGLGRSREIMVQIWYPADPGGQHLANYRRRRETTWLSSYMDVLWTHAYLNVPMAKGSGPFPVLLFNPAWTRQRTQNTYQMEDLASHGFIVAGIDHTYNSGPVAFPDGRVIRTGDAHDITDFRHTTVDQQIAIGDREARVEAGDDILTLNYLAAQDMDSSSPWFRRVDATNAGAFGHSFGGAVAAQTCYEDARVKAALNEDGWMFGDVSTHGLNKPYMAMGSDIPDPTPADLNSADVQKRREARLDMRDDRNMNMTLHDFGGYLIVIRGAKHNNFCDRTLYSPRRKLTEGGAISAQRAHEIVEAYTLQFFSHYLLKQPSPLLNATPSPFKEVQFENWFEKNALPH